MITHGGEVKADIEALLELQAEDERMHGLHVEREGLAPKLSDLDRQREFLIEVTARAKQALDAEEGKEHELQTKVAEQRHLLERNQAQLETVRKTKEATAAMVQLDASRRMLAQTESELQTSVRRVVEFRAAHTAAEDALAEMEMSQEEERGRVAAERARLDAEVAALGKTRDQLAAKVTRQLLSRYDRIRGKRRVTAVYALRASSCGNCDTAIPMQRRNIMMNDETIEMCEACGVLLYAMK
jgi:hypothetical protein